MPAVLAVNTIPCSLADLDISNLDDTDRGQRKLCEMLPEPSLYVYIYLRSMHMTPANAFVYGSNLTKDKSSKFKFGDAGEKNQK